MISRKALAAVVGLVLLILAALAADHLSRRSQRDLARWKAGVAAGLREFEPAALSPVMDLPYELRESSGVAASVRNPGVLWTHNDSGHGPVVYGIQPGSGFPGGVVARLRLRDAPATDWEDIAVGPCPSRAPSPCVYVADIGDNFARRASVALIVFEEPRLHGRRGESFDVEWAAARVRYPDGPVDAEGVAVSEAGDLMVVTKEAGSRGGRVFQLSRDELVRALREGPVTMRAVGTGPTRWSIGVTAAAWAGNGELVVRTTYEVFFWRRAGDEWTQARPPCFVGHAGWGGEGLDAPRPGALYLTREAGRGKPAGLDVAVCAR